MPLPFPAFMIFALLYGSFVSFRLAILRCLKLGKRLLFWSLIANMTTALLHSTVEFRWIRPWRQNIGPIRYPAAFQAAVSVVPKYLRPAVRRDYLTSGIPWHSHTVYFAGNRLRSLWWVSYSADYARRAANLVQEDVSTRVEEVISRSSPRFAILRDIVEVWNLASESKTW